MKSARPFLGEALPTAIIETEHPRYWARTSHFQVFLSRPAAVAYVAAFIAAAGFVAYVDRRIAMRQIGRAP